MISTPPVRFLPRLTRRKSCGSTPRTRQFQVRNYSVRPDKFSPFPESQFFNWEFQPIIYGSNPIVSIFRINRRPVLIYHDSTSRAIMITLKTSILLLTCTLASCSIKYKLKTFSGNFLNFCYPGLFNCQFIPSLGGMNNCRLYS